MGRRQQFARRLLAHNIGLVRRDELESGIRLAAFKLFNAQWSGETLNMGLHIFSQGGFIKFVCFSHLGEFYVAHAVPYPDQW